MHSLTCCSHGLHALVAFVFCEAHKAVCAALMGTPGPVSGPESASATCCREETGRDSAVAVVDGGILVAQAMGPLDVRYGGQFKQFEERLLSLSHRLQGQSDRSAVRTRVTHTPMESQQPANKFVCFTNKVAPVVLAILIVTQPNFVKTLRLLGFLRTVVYGQSTE